MATEEQDRVTDAASLLLRMHELLRDLACLNPKQRIAFVSMYRLTKRSPTNDVAAICSKVEDFWLKSIRECWSAIDKLIQAGTVAAIFEHALQPCGECPACKANDEQRQDVQHSEGFGPATDESNNTGDTDAS